MKCELETSKLQTAIKIVQKALTSRAQLPILTSIKIEVTDQNCILSATDLFIGIQIKLTAKVDKTGVVIVPGKQFRELINSLSGDRVLLEQVSNQLTVKHRQSLASFSLYSLDEYPDFPTIKGSSTSINLSLLETIEQKTFFAASTDQTRPILTGVLLNTVNGVLEAVATDGFRLSKVKLQSRFNLTNEQSQLLIPTQSLKEVITIAREQGVEMVKLIISKSDRQLLFKIGTVQVHVRLLDGAYPPYEKIIPTTTNTQAYLSREELLKHLKRALIFCQDASNIVRLSFSDKLNISAISTVAGKYEGSMAIEKITGEGGEIAFNGHYLIDYLASSQHDLVIFEMVESLKPAVFKWPEEDGIYVVMPFRVNQSA